MEPKSVGQLIYENWIWIGPLVGGIVGGIGAGLALVIKDRIEEGSLKRRFKREYLVVLKLEIEQFWSLLRKGDLERMSFPLRQARKYIGWWVPSLQAWFLKFAPNFLPELLSLDSHLKCVLSYLEDIGVSDIQKRDFFREYTEKIQVEPTQVAKALDEIYARIQAFK
jgi:hypothetical protein